LNVYLSREKPELAPLGTTPEYYIADTVIQLTYVQQHNRRIRYLEVVKSRGQEVLTGLHTFTVGKGGVTVFPRQKMPGVQPELVVFGADRAAFGVPGLDEMLHGGLLRRSSTLLAGSSGTGKTILSMQFLLHGAKLGEPGLFVTMEEPAVQIIANAESLAPDVQKVVDAGLLTALQLSPLETDINQQIVMVREKMRAVNAKRLVFDSLSNYADVLPEVDYKEYVYALLSFVKGSGITAVFTEEIRELTEVEKVTPFGTSYLLDNIIMLRFVELANSLRRAIVILKTRNTAHASDIREYVIKPEGLEILPLDPNVPVPVLSLQQYSHILTPFPTLFGQQAPSRPRGSRGRKA
jgi:circadian clock protein KaiC